MDKTDNSRKASNSLGKGLIKSISNDFKSVSVDIGELTLDSFLESGILKDIPFFSSFAKVASIGKSIPELLFAKKVLKFLIELDKIPHHKRISFLSRIEHDPKFENRVGEQLLLFIDRMDDIEKTTLLAKVFSKYILEVIDYEMFVRLSTVIDKSLLSDLMRLKDYDSNKDSSYTTLSLVNVGLLYQSVSDGGTDSVSGGFSRFSPTKLAKTYLEIVS